VAEKIVDLGGIQIYIQECHPLEAGCAVRFCAPVSQFPASNCELVAQASMPVDSAIHRKREKRACGFPRRKCDLFWTDEPVPQRATLHQHFELQVQNVRLRSERNV
jgi:hypothetical protein